MVVYVYTNGGGEGVLATDSLELLGIEIEETPDDIKEKLKSILPPFASLKNPIDTTAQASEDQYIEGLKIILNDNRTEGILAILLPQLPWYTLDFPRKFSGIYNKKPIVFVVYGGEYSSKIKNELSKIVPVFDYPDSAAKALKFILDLRRSGFI